MRRNVLVRAVFFAAGTVCLALAAVGVFLPILPTTPFLLLTAAFYLRSSERMYSWLYENKYFGEHLRNYRDGKGIPLATKLFTAAMLWTVILYSIFFISTHWALSGLLAIIAISVSVHILLIPTLKN